MEFHEYGKADALKILLIPGNMMCYRQFEKLIPLLEEKYHVIAVSLDGYDGNGRTVFTTAEKAAIKLEDYIMRKLDGEISLVFGESFGSAAAVMLFHRKKVKVGAMILNGPQYLNLGPLSKILEMIIPRNQYKLLGRINRQKKLPWLLKLYTRSDDEKLLEQFCYAAKNVSYETLKNATREALRLYDKTESFPADPSAAVAVWYGEKEPNMKKALTKLKKVYPALEDHPFRGMGHGELMNYPELMADEIDRFIRNRLMKEG